MTIETVSTARAFGGVQGVHKHQSTSTGTEMTFSVFLPPQAEQRPRPVVHRSRSQSTSLVASWSALVSPEHEHALRPVVADGAVSEGAAPVMTPPR
jgi:S-formylglutathione hydrolase FrmB